MPHNVTSKVRLVDELDNGDRKQDRRIPALDYHEQAFGEGTPTVRRCIMMGRRLSGFGKQGQLPIAQFKIQLADLISMAIA